MKKTGLALITEALLIFLLVGCGSDGAGGVPESDPTANQQAYYALSSDTYGIRNPTWIEVSEDAIGLVLRAEEISSSQEMWFDTNVFRVDCRNGVAPGTYDLGESESVCKLTIFNCQSSSNIKTVAGTLTVTEAGDWFSGSIEAVITDADEPEETLHWFSASFAAPVGFGEPLAVTP